MAFAAICNTIGLNERAKNHHLMPLAPQRHHAPHGLRILLSGKLTLQRDGEELYDDSFFVVLDIRQREKERKVLQVMIGKNRLHWAALSGEGIFFS